jgi:hypothetical protein
MSRDCPSEVPKLTAFHNIYVGNIVTVLLEVRNVTAFQINLCKNAKKTCPVGNIVSVLLEVRNVTAFQIT